EGYHDIYIHIDRADKITEDNENNNKFYNTVAVSSAPDAINDLAGSATSAMEIDLNWHATGDDGYTGDLNNSTFTIQYTSVTAWAQSEINWSTDTTGVPSYVYTVDIATTGVAAQSQRFYRQENLLANTTYYFRIWTHDDFISYSALSNGATVSTLAEPVISTQVYNVFYTSVTLNWAALPLSPPSSTCEGYKIQASTAPDFTGIFYSSSTLDVKLSTLTIRGLTVSTTYYFRVGSLNWTEEPNYILSGSTCTMSPVPDTPPIEPYVSNVHKSNITVDWTANNPDNGYILQASTASDFTGTVSSSQTADGTATSLTVSEPALHTNTIYYLRAGAIWGSTTWYAQTLSSSTLAESVASVQFEEVFITSISVSWPVLPQTPSSSTCEGYRLDASTSSDFYGTIFSSSTPSVNVATLTVTGLSPNTTYYFRIGTLNWNSVANYLLAGSTSTLANLPGQESPWLISNSSCSITAQWTAGDPENPGGTNYILEASSTNFSGGTILSSATFNLQAEVLGLMSNTTYYLRTIAVNWQDIKTYGQVMGSTSTLTKLVEDAQFYRVNITSVTVNWKEFLTSPSSSTCSGYIVQASTASDFSGEIFSSSTLNGVTPSTLTVKNLYSETTYYFRVGAYNWNFVPNYFAMGSTKTKVAVPPPDLSINNWDITFNPTEADFGWNVDISADVRNLSNDFMEELTEKQETGATGFLIQSNQYLAQGFVVSEDLSILSVEMWCYDYGSTGDMTTITITTGTTDIPSTGAEIIASTKNTVSTEYEWVKFKFNGPVRLPVLPAGDAYWIIAKNSESPSNGWVWKAQENTNPYTPASSAFNDGEGTSWNNGGNDDQMFRVYQSSNIVVSFYDGDPDDGGTLIGVSTIAALNTNQTETAVLSWTATSPEANRDIYAYIDRANDIGESDETNNKAYNTIAISSAPDTVSDFFASTNSTTDIDLEWTVTGDDGYTGDLNNAEFIIQYTSSLPWAEGNSWDPESKNESYVYRVSITTTGVTAQSQRFYTQTGLGINTTYYFRMWIKDDFGRYSGLSNGATVCTLAAIPQSPAEPFDGVYFSSVAVSWLANGNPSYTEYQLQASTASDFTGTLYGPYAGPDGWFTGVSTDAISLLGCTTFYFQVQARNEGGIETGFQSLGSTKTLVYFDCGLRVYDGTQIVNIACQPTYCTGDSISPLRMHKDGENLAIGLVDVADPKASKIRIQTPAGIKSCRQQ
ncbi:hypothetical protein DRJ17_07005, partial [Candidatus Woesearchaeota archaeon]